MEKDFLHVNIPSQDHKSFFALVGRGTMKDFRRLVDFAESETKIRIYYRCVSEDYLKVFKADTGEPIPETSKVDVKEDREQ